MAPSKKKGKVAPAAVKAQQTKTRKKKEPPNAFTKESIRNVMALAGNVAGFKCTGTVNAYNQLAIKTTEFYSQRSAAIAKIMGRAVISAGDVEIVHKANNVRPVMITVPSSTARKKHKKKEQ